MRCWTSFYTNRGFRYYLSCRLSIIMSRCSFLSSSNCEHHLFTCSSCLLSSDFSVVYVALATQPSPHYRRDR
ncbi:uncharacterized protein BT62DRAFT_695390 [Guyanagaster necrorhizus]|uniref:Uncharacterized protein n=1 Tax=Guyanagaster necrorhizus TaxID=856835 RepID=A0A9P7VFM0_9AGAR|nr:uncharacterized protein BT62DRAFT_695390 [Guyanagaster necrorhizus MCA 3950]KAG7439688.1 hypothetical protein BT62DRAFT_695390 [Guyanagaster necrorhizus MCA 3950]